MTPSNPKTIRLAISTCPNDTFAFHAILNQQIDLEGLVFEIELLDIQQLNRGLFAGDFDVAKASFHAALLLADQTVVLRSGSALGFGVGPLLLAAHSDCSPAHHKFETPAITLCPGEHTTATLLMKVFYQDALANGQSEIQHCVFSDIMPALQQAKANFGVCIHEGRFTWQQQGLALVEDLGSRWETETNSPLPLGGILARRHLAEPTIGRVQSVIRRSIEYGLANRAETLPTMRKYAQEFNDEVLNGHVELYVNQWTLDLGTTGISALIKLSEMARQRGITDANMKPITIFP